MSIIDITDPPYGASPTLADNSAAINAAVAASQTFCQRPCFRLYHPAHGRGGGGGWRSAKGDRSSWMTVQSVFPWGSCLNHPAHDRGGSGRQPSKTSPPRPWRSR